MLRYYRLVAIFTRVIYVVVLDLTVEVWWLQVYGCVHSHSLVSRGKNRNKEKRDLNDVSERDMKHKTNKYKEKTD